MATVLDIMELYRAITALLKPLEGAFGRAWQSIWAGGMGLPDWIENTANYPGVFRSGFKGNFKSSGEAFLMNAYENPAVSGLNSVFKSDSAAPRQAADFSGLGVFNQAIGLPGNGSFFYTDFGDKGASGRIGSAGSTGRTGRTGHSGERGLDTFPEKIRGGYDGFRSAGGAFVLPDYGANFGMVLDNQLIGKQISGIGGVDLGDSGYFNFSGEFGNSGASGEKRGLLYSFERFENPENGLVPNARTEEFDFRQNTEYLRIADSLKIGDDVLNGEPPEAVRSYAEREMSGFGGYGGSNINIDMSSMKNIVNSKSDMDELIDRLCGAISEAAFSMAEGVHS